MWLVRDWEGDWVGDGLGVWEGELIGVGKACEHPGSLSQHPQEPGPRSCHKAHPHDPGSIVSDCWVITGRAGWGRGQPGGAVLALEGLTFKEPLRSALPRPGELGDRRGHCVARGGVDFPGPTQRNGQQRRAEGQDVAQELDTGLCPGSGRPDRVPFVPAPRTPAASPVLGGCRQEEWRGDRPPLPLGWWQAGLGTAAWSSEARSACSLQESGPSSLQPADQEARDVRLTWALLGGRNSTPSSGSCSCPRPPPS